jgi:hypothetical protein
MKILGNKFIVGFIAGSLIFGGSAFAIGVSNTPETGYLFCVNNKTKAVTFPGTLKCPSGTKPVELGARGLAGPAGERGASGPTGPAGPAGSGLKVYDANGKVIGDLTFGSSYGEWGVLINGLPIVVSPNTGRIPSNDTAGLTTKEDCSGTKYIEGYEFSSIRFTKSDPWFLTKFGPDGAPTGVIQLAVPKSQDKFVTGIQMYVQSSSGCNPFYPDGGGEGLKFFELDIVGEVKDFAGPLSIK